MLLTSMASWSFAIFVGQVALVLFYAGRISLLQLLLSKLTLIFTTLLQQFLTWDALSDALASRWKRAHRRQLLTRLRNLHSSWWSSLWSVNCYSLILNVPLQFLVLNVRRWWTGPFGLFRLDLSLGWPIIVHLGSGSGAQLLHLVRRLTHGVPLLLEGAGTSYLFWDNLFLLHLLGSKSIWISNWSASLLNIGIILRVITRKLWFFLATWSWSWLTCLLTVLTRISFLLLLSLSFIVIQILDLVGDWIKLGWLVLFIDCCELVSWLKSRNQHLFKDLMSTLPKSLLIDFSDSLHISSPWLFSEALLIHKIESTGCYHWWSILKHFII